MPKARAGQNGKRKEQRDRKRAAHLDEIAAHHPSPRFELGDHSATGVDEATPTARPVSGPSTAETASSPPGPQRDAAGPPAAPSFAPVPRSSTVSAGLGADSGPDESMSSPRGDMPNPGGIDRRDGAPASTATSEQERIVSNGNEHPDPDESRGPRGPHREHTGGYELAMSRLRLATGVAADSAARPANEPSALTDPIAAVASDGRPVATSPSEPVEPDATATTQDAVAQSPDQAADVSSDLHHGNDRAPAGKTTGWSDASTEPRATTSSAAESGAVGQAAHRWTSSRWLIATVTLGTVSGLNRWAVRRLTGADIAILGPGRIRPMILGTGMATLVASLYLTEE